MSGRQWEAFWQAVARRTAASACECQCQCQCLSSRGTLSLAIAAISATVDRTTRRPQRLKARPFRTAGSVHGRLVVSVHQVHLDEQV